MLARRVLGELPLNNARIAVEKDLSLCDLVQAEAMVIVVRVGNQLRHPVSVASTVEGVHAVI